MDVGPTVEVIRPILSLNWTSLVCIQKLYIGGTKKIDGNL